MTNKRMSGKKRCNLPKNSIYTVNNFFMRGKFGQAEAGDFIEN